jgi:hypothetical protein
VEGGGGILLLAPTMSNAAIELNGNIHSNKKRTAETNIIKMNSNCLKSSLR